MKHTKTKPDIPIIYEDDHLLVINKPHNVLSQKDQTQDPDVVTLCKEYLQRQQPTESPYLGLVHRLDRPVGGLMLLAKTTKAARNLSRQMRDRLIQKTYWAAVWGNPPENGLLTHYLFKDRENNIVNVVGEGHEGSKEAILSFERLEQGNDLALLAVHLQTGRPHQIRVQLAEEGYPIWGDYKYGKHDISSGKTIALRAVELNFKHPVHSKQQKLVLPPPLQEPWKSFEHELS